MAKAHVKLICSNKNDNGELQPGIKLNFTDENVIISILRCPDRGEWQTMRLTYDKTTTGGQWVSSGQWELALKLSPETENRIKEPQEGC
mgnify:CR=1 FL=1|jgi:hypothetical protein